MKIDENGNRTGRLNIPVFAEWELNLLVRTALGGGPTEDRAAAFQQLCDRGALTEEQQHDFRCQMLWASLYGGGDR